MHSFIPSTYLPIGGYVVHPFLTTHVYSWPPCRPHLPLLSSQSPEFGPNVMEKPIASVYLQSLSCARATPLICPIQTVTDCNICGKTTSHGADLLQDLKSLTANKEKLYVHCPRIFFRNATLTYPNKMYDCSYSGRTDRSNLRTHLNV